jgi:hypothetical protein
MYSYVGHSSSVGVDSQIGIGNASAFLEGVGYAVTWPIGTGSLGLGFTPSDPLPVVVFWSPTTEFLPSASASYGAQQGNLNVEKKASDLFHHIEMQNGEGHRGGGRAHANGLAQNARSGQLVYDQGIRQLQRLAAAGANSKAGDR